MKQNLSVVVISLLLSACGNNTTTYHYPNGEPYAPSNISKSEQLVDSARMSRYSEGKHTMGLHNLSDASSYQHYTAKKADGSTVNENKISQLPNVANVLAPEFKNNLILDYLRYNKADMLKTETFFPGDKIGHLSISEASMPNSSLKKIMKCDAFETPVEVKMQKIIRNIYNAAFAQSKESVVVVPMWRNQTAEVETRLYDAMISAAYDAAKKSPDLKVTLFATSREEKSALNEAIERQSIKLKITTPSPALANVHTAAIANQLTSGETSSRQWFGAHSVDGAAADVGGFKLLGVMATQSQHQEHTSLLIGQRVGSCFYAAGAEFGIARRELNYSAVKAATFYTLDQNWTFSTGLSMVSETLAMPFMGTDSFERKGVIGEFSAHFTQSFQDIKMTADVGGRAFYAGQFQSAWFGQVSLISAAVKISAVVSSMDAGINFSYEN